MSAEVSVFSFRGGLIAGWGPVVMSHDIWQHCSLLSGRGLDPQQRRVQGHHLQARTHSLTLTHSFTHSEAKQDITV